MSFRKIKLIDPNTIDHPESGHIYLGRDDKGLWEKYSNGEWVYIITGGTTGAGSSGSSGVDGSSGKDGIFYGSSGSSGIDGSSGLSGSSGSSGKSGINGTNGTSGISGTSGSSGSSGKSGTSGVNGSSGSSGTSGSSGKSGSSGVDGNFYGSSGSSGYSGGYGAATRAWLSTNTYPPSSSNGLYGTSNIYTGFNFALLDLIAINPKDFDGNILTFWLNEWNGGILKIEDIDNPVNFGIYSITNGYSLLGGNYIFTDFVTLAGNGSLNNNFKYLVSFSKGGSGSSGSSGVDINITNNVNNYLITSTGTNELFGNSGLTFDGENLNVINNINVNNSVVCNKLNYISGITSGEIIYFGNGSGLTSGKIYYLNIDNDWVLADDSSFDSSTGFIGIALGNSSLDDGILIRGFSKFDTYSEYANGCRLYLSSNGDFSNTLENSYERMIGYSLNSVSNKLIYFNPDLNYKEYV